MKRGIKDMSWGSKRLADGVHDEGKWGAMQVLLFPKLLCNFSDSGNKELFTILV